MTFSDLLSTHGEMPSIQPHEIFSIGPLSFSSSSMMALLALLTFVVLARIVSKFKLVPGRFQSGVEAIVEMLYSFVEGIVRSKETASKIFPYVASVFLFILFSNLAPLIPFINGFTYHGHHLFTGSTADFNTTFALALASVVIIHIVGIINNGTLHHLGHFIQIKPIIDAVKNGKTIKEKVAGFFLGLVQFFVGLIEFISEFAKVISLSLRLFGNMFAHEVLMVILLGAFAFVVPALWMGMGILVGVVQAIVFTALITVYYSLLVGNGDKKVAH